MVELNLEDMLRSIPADFNFSGLNEDVVASGFNADAIEIIYEAKDTGERVSFTAKHVTSWTAFRNAGGTVDIRYTATKDNGNEDYSQHQTTVHESNTGDVVGVVEVKDANTATLHNFRKETSLFTVEWGSEWSYSV